MINNQKVVALIPARGGSTSIPKKNLIYLGGKPLIKWSIDAAKEVLEIDDIYVSSDNNEILSYAKTQNIKTQKRPKYLATNVALIIDTINYFCKKIAKSEKSIDILILLEPTSPLRKKKIITKCLKRLVNEKLDSIASFIPTKTPPERVWKFSKNMIFPLDKTKCWTSRQKLETKYELDGSIFIFKTNKHFKNKILHGKVGAEILNHKDVVEIDTYDDLFYAQNKIKSKKI